MLQSVTLRFKCVISDPYYKAFMGLLKTKAKTCITKARVGELLLAGNLYPAAMCGRSCQRQQKNTFHSELSCSCSYGWRAGLVPSWLHGVVLLTLCLHQHGAIPGHPLLKLWPSCSSCKVSHIFNKGKYMVIKLLESRKSRLSIVWKSRNYISENATKMEGQRNCKLCHDQGKPLSTLATRTPQP